MCLRPSITPIEANPHSCGYDNRMDDTIKTAEAASLWVDTLIKHYKHPTIFDFTFELITDLGEVKAPLAWPLVAAAAQHKGVTVPTTWAEAELTWDDWVKNLEADL